VRDAAQSVHLVAATTGFLSYVLLWATIMWGLVLGRGWTMTRFKHSNVYATHMTLALIGMTLGWGHAFTQLANPVGTVFLLDEFLPFANSHDPLGIGAGVVATEIMTALLISMPLQRKLGYSRWRLLHSLAYASFTLLAGHVLLSGSDVGPLYVKIPIAALWASTVVAWVVLSGRPSRGEEALASGMGAEPVAEPVGGPVAEPVGGGRRSAGRRGSGRRGGAGAGSAGVQVDPGKCARFGFCEQEAPDVFELRTDGRLGYRTTVSAEEIEAVARAVKVCPARAIKMTRTAPQTDPRPEEPAPEPAGGRPDNVTDLRRDRRR
jgi:ferredoxin/DMSO/TMAO reductase YedYZ heme-binding membrane subunit